ncbi:MAG: HlyD family efflux transporter periplasmic adaptor subunit [Paracoccus sp. (in: a-proteobacteria)]|nr:HlyD family efflux transporter periplasmic adaptor subunit [Paracoccus sp. (in: a-proteobacteria)]
MSQQTPPTTDKTVARPPLFRPEAVAYQSRSLDGDVMLRLSMPMQVLIALAVLIVVGALIFAGRASYARMETVGGWVVPEGGLIRITAPQGGTIEALPVTEGESVKAGQSLARLRLSSDTDQGDAGAMIAAQLQSQIEAVRSLARAERDKLIADEEALTAQRDAMESELAQSRARIDTMSERLELVQANADRVREIGRRGFASMRSIEEAEMAVLTAEQDLVDVRTSIMTMERQLAEMEAALRAIPINIRAAEAQAREGEAVLARQSTEVAVQNTYTASATVGGRVVAVPVTQGQAVAPQSVIAVLTPEGASLEAELYVPSRAAGFIEEGQEVQLMYQAYPYQKFGVAEGRITSFSRTVLAPTEIAIPGLEIAEPVFRVKVALARDSVTAYGQDMPVQPGMLLSANIVIDRRSLLEWLLDPIYAVGRLG